jgi:hypothetical protein
MATTAELEDMVGYRLGLTISATSVPTTTEVQSWLWEAAKKIAKKADPKFIENLITSHVYTTNNILVLSAVTNYLRPVGLRVWYGADAATLDQTQKAEYLSPGEYTIASNGSSAFIKGTTEFPVWTLSGGAVKWYPNYPVGPTDSSETNVQSINSYETSFTLSGSVDFAAGDYIKINDEVMYIASLAMDVVVVQRGQCGTIAAAHDATQAVYRLDETDLVNFQTVVFEHITEPTDAAGLDNQFDELLVDYATMMAKLQDEELADAQVFGQLFMAEFGGGEKK